MSAQAVILGASGLPAGLPAVEPNGDNEWVDNEAYRELFVSVILLRIRQQETLTPSERKKLRGLTEDGDPEEFFASRWFEDICRMIGVTAEVIRERLEVLSSGLATT